MYLELHNLKTIITSFKANNFLGYLSNFIEEEIFIFVCRIYSSKKEKIFISWINSFFAYTPRRCVLILYPEKFQNSIFYQLKSKDSTISELGDVKKSAE